MAMLTQTCRISGESFPVLDQDLNFYTKMAPHFAGQSFVIPVPTLCPRERKRQRLSFRNLRTLYKRKCDKSGKDMLSYHSPDNGFTVYDSEAWWGDDWNALDYGRDFDFSRPFFEQFQELYREVPHLARAVIFAENCDYINGASNCKNCYLSFNMDFCEDCYYLTDGKKCRDCVDSYALNNCELCYESMNLERCYNVRYSFRSISCSDSAFLMDCRQCKNCVGCVNLVGKENYLFNQASTPEEIARYMEGFKEANFVEEFKKSFEAFALKHAKKYYYGHSNEDSTGNDLQNTKNCHQCFFCENTENCRYCYYVFNSKNCMDYDIFGDHSEWIYNCLATGMNCSNDICCMHTWSGSSNNLYCFLLSGSSNNFGCVGLKQQNYCIFNKQYSRKDYGILAAKIITHMQKTGEWGEFFPASLSPFAYNETMAHQIFPLTKEEALKRGLNWKDMTVVKDFRIIPQEERFYKKMGIPQPTLSPNERFEKRYAQSLPQELWERDCDQCGHSLQSPYSPDRPEIIYCDACYERVLT